MSSQAATALELALELPPIERAELVERILASFQSPAAGTAATERAEIEAAWARESESRIDAYERGQMATLSADAVFAQLNQP